jgi:hypothetical protein
MLVLWKTNCGAVLAKHHVSVGVLLREGIVTGWLAKESGWTPTCKEGKDCDYCEGGSKNYAAEELRRSYIIVQASRDVREHSRGAAVGELNVENVEMVMHRVAVLARTERNHVFESWCVINLGKELWRNKKACLCDDWEVCMGCTKLRPERVRFIHIERYKGVFPHPEVPWFAGVTNAIDGVRQFDCEAIVWLNCRGTWPWLEEAEYQRHAAEALP